jgi:hypothetical protein
MCVESCSFNTNVLSNQEDNMGSVENNLDHSDKIYRFGEGPINTAPTTEYCVVACPTAVNTKLNWFLNSDGDKECTSECSPPLNESIKHVTGTSRDTITLLYANEDSGLHECIPDCSLHDLTDEKCRGECETSATDSFRTFTEVLVPKDSTDVDPTVDVFTTEEVCAPVCTDGDQGSFYFTFDHETNGTADDERLCVPQCPPVTGDFTAYFDSEANQT